MRDGSKECPKGWLRYFLDKNHLLIGGFSVQSLIEYAPKCNKIFHFDFHFFLRGSFDLISIYPHLVLWIQVCLSICVHWKFRIHFKPDSIKQGNDAWSNTNTRIIKRQSNRRIRNGECLIFGGGRGEEGSRNRDCETQQFVDDTEINLQLS